MTDTNTKLAAELRAWAKGMLASSAAVELLVRHGRLAYDGAPWIHTSERGTVWVDPTALREESGYLSGSERRIAALASNLLGGPPVDLGETLSSLDPRTLAVVIGALTLAGGGTPQWPAT